MEEIVIVSGVRTPVGKFQGSLSDVSATTPRRGRGARGRAARAASSRSRSTNASWATSSRRDSGRIPRARLPSSAACRRKSAPSPSTWSAAQDCAPSRSRAQSIQTGNAEIVVAGGMESMTNAPYLLPQARSGFRMGNAVAVDSMVHDGLWDVYNDFHMGQTAELVAEKYGITREEQDCFALLSHRKARPHGAKAASPPKSFPWRSLRRRRASRRTLFERDESIREDASHRSAARPQARLQKGRHRHRRQRSGRQRRGGRCRRHVRGESARARPDADGAHRRARHQRHRSQMGHDGARQRRAQSHRAGRLVASTTSTSSNSTRPSPCRRSPSLRELGIPAGESQRQRRIGRHRSRHRRQRRARAGHPDARDDPPQRPARPRRTLPRRRQLRRHGIERV